MTYQTFKLNQPLLINPNKNNLQRLISFDDLSTYNDADTTKFLTYQANGEAACDIEDYISDEKDFGLIILDNARIEIGKETHRTNSMSKIGLSLDSIKPGNGLTKDFNINLKGKSIGKCSYHVIKDELYLVYSGTNYDVKFEDLIFFELCRLGASDELSGSVKFIITCTPKLYKFDISSYLKSYLFKELDDRKIIDSETNTKYNVFEKFNITLEKSKRR